MCRFGLVSLAVFFGLIAGCDGPKARADVDMPEDGGVSSTHDSDAAQAADDAAGSDASVLVDVSVPDADADVDPCERGCGCVQLNCYYTCRGNEEVSGAAECVGDDIPPEHEGMHSNDEWVCEDPVDVCVKEYGGRWIPCSDGTAQCAEPDVGGECPANASDRPEPTDWYDTPAGGLQIDGRVRPEGLRDTYISGDLVLFGTFGRPEGEYLYTSVHLTGTTEDGGGPDTLRELESLEHQIPDLRDAGSVSPVGLAAVEHGFVSVHRRETDTVTPFTAGHAILLHTSDGMAAGRSAYTEWYRDMAIAPGREVAGIGHVAVIAGYRQDPDGVVLELLEAADRPNDPIFVAPLLGAELPLQAEPFRHSDELMVDPEGDFEVEWSERYGYVVAVTHRIADGVPPDGAPDSFAVTVVSFDPRENTGGQWVRLGRIDWPFEDHTRNVRLAIDPTNGSPVVFRDAQRCRGPEADDGTCADGEEFLVTFWDVDSGRPEDIATREGYLLQDAAVDELGNRLILVTSAGGMVWGATLELHYVDRHADREDALITHVLSEAGPYDDGSCERLAWSDYWSWNYASLQIEGDRWRVSAVVGYWDGLALGDFVPAVSALVYFKGRIRPVLETNFED